MSNEGKIKEVTLVCAVADDSHTIDGAIAYKAPGWDEKDPAANLLCPACSMVVLDDRTGRQVKLDDIREMVAAMTAEDPVEDESVTDALEAPAEPRICGLCGEEIPSDHPHALHEPCYQATNVFYMEDSVVFRGRGEKKRVVTVDKELEFAHREIAKTAEYNGDLDLTKAMELFEGKVKPAYEAGKDLLAVRLSWVARHMAATPYVDKMYDYLVEKSNDLRNDSLLTPEIEQMLIRVEELIGREWNVAAAGVLRGNHHRGRPGAKHLVGLAYQTPKTEQTIDHVRGQITILNEVPMEVPEKAMVLYEQAKKALRNEDPWTANDKAHQAKRVLEPVVDRADSVRRAQFTEGLTFGARVLANAVPDDVDALEELVDPQDHGRGNRKLKVQSERGDGDGRRTGKKQKSKVRGGRRAEEYAAITDSLAREIDEPVLDREQVSRPVAEKVVAGAVA